MIRVLIADDHPLIRRGLRDLLEAAERMQVVAEASNAAQAMELVRRDCPDIVIMDITMPGRTGLDALRDIKREFPQLPVLMLSIHPEDQYAIRAIKAGAAGYLTKESAPEELVNAIEKVIAGGRYVSAHVAECMAEELGGHAQRQPHELLSDREFEVLCLIAQGLSVTQIAERMSLSVKTVSTYRTRILEKTGLKSTADLIRYALKHHLAE
ncbi:MAG: response regulator transcription factor [Candidatus Sumerlaeaceae bacterium]|nr:response regulator transcription factor [Candidatus Sumerlaeaceae bacterium]